MIYAIAKELGAALRAQEVPFHVVFGPESTEATMAARERVVIEQPIDEKRDAVGPPKAVHPNPRMPMVLHQAIRIRIFARANIAGAAWHDHAERAAEVLHRVLAEIDYIVRGRRNAMTYGSGGFVTLKDEKGSLVWSGAVYEIDATIDCGVFRRKWAGEGRDEVVIGTDVEIVSTTKVSNAPGDAGTAPGDAETASGG